MKFDPGKAWQYPVLRPHSDDYPQAEFQVEIELTRTAKGMSASLCAEFLLSDPNLIDLVNKDCAQYVLLVSSPKTRLRKMLETVETKLERNFTAGELSGRVDFSPFLVATRRTQAVDWSGWHRDFGGLDVEIKAGYVLAIDEPKSYWIDRAEEAPLGSIFVCRSGSQDEWWTIDLEQDRIAILMPEESYDLFQPVRKQITKKNDLQYLMNGLYLPALITVLYEVDQNSVAYEDYRWFSSLNNILEKHNCSELGKQNVDRSSDAQKLLALPFNELLQVLNPNK